MYQREHVYYNDYRGASWGEDAGEGLRHGLLDQCGHARELRLALALQAGAHGLAHPVDVYALQTKILRPRSDIS